MLNKIVFLFVILITKFISSSEINDKELFTVIGTIVYKSCCEAYAIQSSSDHQEYVVEGIERVPDRRFTKKFTLKLIKGEGASVIELIDYKPYEVY